MIQRRVIPCLLLSRGGLVKTLKFSSPKYVGDPVNAIRIFNDKEVDELLVLDIDASKNGQPPRFEQIEEFAGECFMPLCYGGGVTTIEQVKRLFAIGVEKVAVQTGALSNLDLVSEIASRYGNQSIVVSIDVKKNVFGQHKLYSSATGKMLSRDWREFIREAVAAGAGEILVNAVDQDGTLAGVDQPLIETAAAIGNVPLIAMGGVGSLGDIKLAFRSGASAVAAGAFFVFHGPHRAVLITYPKYSEITALLES